MKHYIMAHRSAASVAGAASRPLKSGGKVQLFETEDEARTEAMALNAGRMSPNISYTYGGIWEDEGAWVR